MKPFWVFALALLVLLNVAAERSALGADEKDNYEQAYMPRGRYQGMLLDTRDRRSIRILDEKAAAPYHKEAGDIVISNFYHEGKFWIARFPADCVHSIYFQKVVMKTRIPAAHAQLRFKLKAGKDVELYPQIGAELPQLAKIGDVVYSVEAMPVYGDKYDLINGVKNHFGLGLRFMSIQEAYFKSCVLNDQHIEQIPLDVPADAEMVLLREALLRSHQLGMKDMYHTIINSCCTASFGLLDHSAARSWLRMPAYGLEVLPLLPRTYLWLRQLISVGTVFRNRYPSLEVQFAHLKETPGWAERKAQLIARDAADRKVFEAAMDKVATKCDLAAYGQRNKGSESDGAE